MSKQGSKGPTLAAAIAVMAERGQTRPALLDFDGALSYGQLHRSIVALGEELARIGLRRSDRVGLLAPSGLVGGQTLVALACNVILVPINPGVRIDELRNLARLYDLRAVATFGEARPCFQPDLTEMGVASVLIERPAPDRLAARRLDGPDQTVETRPAAADDPIMLLRSSGSTGRPKLIPVTHGNLAAMADRMAWPNWFALGEHDRAACTLPLYYAAGIKTSLFVPLYLGASVCFPPSDRTFALESWTHDLRPTYLSVAPTALLRMLETSDRGQELPDSLRYIMCAAAHLPERVRDDAVATFHLPVLEYYALSEAGVMAANPAPPGVAKPGTVGKPAPGEVLLVDGERRPVAAGEIGQIMISGPTLTPGYLSADDSAQAAWQDGWLLTGDLGRIDEDGDLSIIGRVAEVINRGGEKVFPHEVEEILLQHPGVREAAVFGVPHPRLGENVAAAVTLERDADITEADLKRHVAAQATRFKIPCRIIIFDALLRTESGKVSRRALRDWFAERPHVGVGPEWLFEYQLAEIWQRVLKIDAAGIDDDFYELGGDSLLAAEMLVEVERLTGRRYPHSELATLTIRHMASVVTDALGETNERMTQIRSGDGAPFFFFHGDYLTRGLYAHKLASLLDPHQPIFLLHPPSRIDDKAQLEDIAAGYFDEIARIADGKPCYIGGYCNGALVAWETAAMLRASGVDVIRLVLIEGISLNAIPRMQNVSRLIDRLGAVVPGRVGRFLRKDAMRAVWLHVRGMARFETLAWRALRRKFGFDRSSPRESSEYLTHQSFFRAMCRYFPPRLDVDVVCLIADEGRAIDTDPQRWIPLARSVTWTNVPGTHQSAIVSERAALAAALITALSGKPPASEIVPPSGPAASADPGPGVRLAH